MCPLRKAVQECAKGVQVIAVPTLGSTRTIESALLGRDVTKSSWLSRCYCCPDHQAVSPFGTSAQLLRRNDLASQCFVTTRPAPSAFFWTLSDSSSGTRHK
ncbi:unnamed protein product [Pipistrellus nathusii]|uniref:Uncharacterized protein n=1 Tax=Pipistrellus nathusii TaxID=59473 RepID=A0ABP0ALJ7_PIPNA